MGRRWQDWERSAPHRSGGEVTRIVEVTRTGKEVAEFGNEVARIDWDGDSRTGMEVTRIGWR